MYVTFLLNSGYQAGSTIYNPECDNKGGKLGDGPKWSMTHGRGTLSAAFDLPGPADYDVSEEVRIPSPGKTIGGVRRSVTEKTEFPGPGDYLPLTTNKPRPPKAVIMSRKEPSKGKSTHE